MNYIIMDLEWNQAVCPAKMVRTPLLLYGEIIQIGAVKTDDKFNLIDKIKINVRPKYYKKMNSHVAQITGITDTQLTSGETFPQAFKRFKEWCGGNPAGSGSPAGGEQFRFITWGFDDLSMLADNLTLHGLDPSFGSDYINLQLIYNRQLKSEHLQCALSTAAESLEIPLDVQVHDAFNDAYLTYEVCRKLDMVLGLAEYSEYTAAIPQPLFKDAVNDIKDLKKMVSDSRVVDLNCPQCGGKLTLRQWLFGNGKSCKTIAECPECKEYFLVRLKACMISEHNYTVMRTIFAASDDDITSYENKLKKREERRKQAMERKKAEGNNDKNGNV
ncbi:MAG: exonuclease domain-containing protein [Ruminococcaceae bacterium]|nr:exonuclease domain-containing protein [Oscillospiraceae bacterium]